MRTCEPYAKFQRLVGRYQAELDGRVPARPSTEARWAGVCDQLLKVHPELFKPHEIRVSYGCGSQGVRIQEMKRVHQLASWVRRGALLCQRPRSARAYRRPRDLTHHAWGFMHNAANRRGIRTLVRP